VFREYVFCGTEGVAPKSAQAFKSIKKYAGLLMDWLQISTACLLSKKKKG